MVATYSRIEAVYDALHTAVREPYADTGLELRMHLSHWYPWGTMIYGRFVVPDGGPDALDAARPHLGGRDDGGARRRAAS